MYVSHRLAKAIIAECIIYKDMQNVKECCVSEEIDGRDHAYTYIPSTQHNRCFDSVFPLALFPNIRSNGVCCDNACGRGAAL